MNITTVITETEILQRIHEGDFNAIKELYEKYSVLLYSLVKKIINDDKQAEVIVIEVFLTAAGRINHFVSAQNNFYTRIVTLARNFCAYELRKKEGKIKNISPEVKEEYITPKLSHQIEPMDLEKAYELKEHIKDAFDKLKDNQKFLIYSAYYEGLTIQNISAKLKKPVTSVKSEIENALLNLNENFKDRPSLFIAENEIVETIYPYVLGCLDFEEQLKTFERFKSSEPFPWKLLGEYQNLVSLLPLTLEPEYPADEVERKISDQINQLQKVKSFEQVTSASTGLISEPEENIPKEGVIKEEKKSFGKNIPEKMDTKVSDSTTRLQETKEKSSSSYQTKNKKRNFLPGLLYTAIILFAASALLAYFFYQDKVRYYETQIGNLSNRVETITNELRNKPDIPGIGELSKPQTVKLTNVIDTFSSGEIIFSYDDKRGYLHIKRLPVLDSENAFQLWGNFNGEFVSLSVFKVSSRPDYYPFALPEFVNDGAIEFYVIESNAEGSRRPGSKVYLQGNTRQ